MRKLSISTFFISAAIIMAASCGGNTGKGDGEDGLVFDSLKVDSTLSLTDEASSPTCHVSLSLTYAKGKNADYINDTIIRSGIFSPDYFSVSSKKMSPQEATDTFVTNYLTEYKHDFEKMYMADKEHGASYNYEYIVTTYVIDDNEKYYTYIANIYNYGGGAHGCSIVIARNFNAETGKIVSLKDIFVPGYEQELNGLILKSLCDKYDVADINGLRKQTIFYGIDVYIPDNFIIGKKSITFIYSPDEIASHAQGEIRAEIKNDELERLFRK